MRKNTQEIFHKWENHEIKGGDSISTNSETIFSYRTPILTASDSRKHVVLNTARYSNTTSRQQSDLRNLLRLAGYVEVFEEKGESITFSKREAGK